MKNCFDSGKKTLRVKRNGKNTMAPRKESELRVSQQNQHKSETDGNKKILKKRKSWESKVADLKKELLELQNNLGELDQNLAHIRNDISKAKALTDQNQIYENYIFALFLR